MHKKYPKASTSHILKIKEQLELIIQIRSLMVLFQIFITCCVSLWLHCFLLNIFLILVTKRKKKKKIGFSRKTLAWTECVLGLWRLKRQLKDTWSHHHPWVMLWRNVWFPEGKQVKGEPKGIFLILHCFCFSYDRHINKETQLQW